MGVKMKRKTKGASLAKCFAMVERDHGGCDSNTCSLSVAMRHGYQYHAVDLWIGSGAAHDQYHMKPKHTPGPWNVFESKIEGTWIDPIGVRVDDCGDPKYREANARLIAAAPDMLRALEAAWQYLETNCLGQGKVQRLVYEALAKAEGGK